MIGRTLSHYKITAELGAGGMGEVYLAEDTRLGRRVALKVLPRELSDDPVRLERLEREARALAALDHPGIVTLYSVEEAEGIHFLTMAYIEGRTLDGLIPPDGLPLEEFLELAISLVDAVRAAHERGIVHRDLKPANVMVDREGRLRVLDFGLAKWRPVEQPAAASQLPTEAMTQEGAILGTYPYMSPEQIEGEPVDARSDIFSLGVMLHEMATGERPFRGKKSASLIAAILKEKPAAVDEVRAELPHHLSRIVHRCLAKDPETRYQRAKDLLLELEELRAEGSTTLATPSAPSTASPAAKGRRGVYAAMGVLAILVAGVGAYIAVTKSGPPIESAPDAIRSIAVLPLTNLMNDPEQEYFVDGMTESLIADLAKLGNLRVISRTSMMRYKGTDKSVPEIARELDVDALVQGSVLRAGGQVRITAQLIDGQSDEHLWLETYDRGLTDILALYSDVARAIAGEIELRLTPGEEELLAGAGPVNPEAYEAYLEGRFHLWKINPDAMPKAAERLQRALELDPGFAPAHAAIATLHFWVGFSGVVPPRQAMPLAREAAGRALEIDAKNTEARVILGFVQLTYELDFAAAGDEVQRALALNPNYALAHWLHGNYLAAMGKLDRALEKVRSAQRLDPLWPLYRTGEGWFLGMADRHTEAIVQLRRSLELDPYLFMTHCMLAGNLIRQGLAEEGMRQQEQCYRLQGLADVADAVAEGFHRSGRVEEAFRVAGLELERRAEERYLSPSLIAGVHSRAGDVDRAFEWLERAVEARDGYLALLRRDPYFDGLHSDPRFDALTRRLGLPE